MIWMAFCERVNFIFQKNKKKYLFYKLDVGKDMEYVSPQDIRSKYLYYLWKPRSIFSKPPGLPIFPFLIWSIIFFKKSLFSNNGYKVYLILSNNKCINYCVILPFHFKFPFMGSNDFQIGPVWTHPNYKGKGLAKFSVRRIIELYSKEKPASFWYITRAENLASIRLAESLGFEKVGEGERLSPFGIYKIRQFY